MKKNGFTIVEILFVLLIMASLLVSTFYLYKGNIQRNVALSVTNQLLTIDGELKNINIALYNTDHSLKLVINPSNNYESWLVNTDPMINWYNQTFQANFQSLFPPIILTNTNFLPIVQQLNTTITMNYNGNSVSLSAVLLKGFQYTFDTNEECQIAMELVPNKTSCNNNILTYTLNNGNGYLVGLVQ